MKKKKLEEIYKCLPHSKNYIKASVLHQLYAITYNI